MVCDSLLTTSLLQVVYRFLASLLPKLDPQACNEFFQQVVTSLQMAIATSLILTDYRNLMKLTSLLQLVNKLNSR